MGQAAYKTKTNVTNWNAQRGLKKEKKEKERERAERTKKIDSKWSESRTGATAQPASNWTSVFGTSKADEKKRKADEIAAKYEKK